MEMLLESQMRERARQAGRTTDTIFESAMAKVASVKTPDIFLSHSVRDKELILGVALTLEDLGYSVYIDWRDDPQLDRNFVSKDTAAVLRARMLKCKSLFYMATDNATNSKWMPWELGYKDGQSGKVAIAKVYSSQYSKFSGQEYIDIYPYIEITNNTQGKKTIFICESNKKYVAFDSWITGTEPFQR